MTTGPVSSTSTPTPTAKSPALIASPQELSGSAFPDAVERVPGLAVAQGLRLVLPSGQSVTSRRIVLPSGVDLEMPEGARITGSLPGTRLLRLAEDSTRTGGSIENSSTTSAFDIDLAVDAKQGAISGVTFCAKKANAV